MTCADVAPHVRPAANAPGPQWTSWSESVSHAGRDLYLTALPVAERGEPIGFLMLLHDRGFADQREKQLLRLLVGTFAVLACAASLLTIFVTRVSWRGWSNELRRLLRGGMTARSSSRSCRTCASSSTASWPSASSTAGGAWTPQRLKNTLNRHLHGERVVVVANREPYIHERDADGQIAVRHPASGLVTALEPVMRACSGVWVAHGSGSADRETVGRARPRARAARRGVLPAAARLADRGRRARLLLRLRQRGPVAAVPRRAHAADLPHATTGSTTRR